MCSLGRAATVYMGLLVCCVVTSVGGLVIGRRGVGLNLYVRYVIKITKKEDCKSSEKECTNCKYMQEVLKIQSICSDHYVFDLDLQVYQSQLKLSRERVKYDF